MYQPIILNVFTRSSAHKPLFQASQEYDISENGLNNKAASSKPLENLIQKAYPSVTSLIDDALISGKKLGTGYYGTVYSIPKLDDYVLKVIHNKHLTLSEKNAQPSFTAFPQEDTFGLNVGQSVASFGPKYSLLKRQEGDSLSVNHTKLRVQGSDRLYKITGIPDYQNRYKTFLEEVDRIPQAGFNQLAANLNKIKADPGLYFDPSPNNILIDTANQRFNIIDCETKRESAEHLTGMLMAVTDSVFAFIDERAIRTNHPHLMPPKEVSVATDPYPALLRLNIVKKCLIAAHKEGLPTPRQAVQPNEQERHMPWWQESYIFRICGLGEKREKIYDLLLQQPRLDEATFVRKLNKLIQPAFNFLKDQLPIQNETSHFEHLNREFGKKFQAIA